jgi:hypothetical protein
MVDLSWRKCLLLRGSQSVALAMHQSRMGKCIYSQRQSHSMRVCLGRVGIYTYAHISCDELVRVGIHLFLSDRSLLKQLFILDYSCVEKYGTCSIYTCPRWASDYAKDATYTGHSGKGRCLGPQLLTVIGASPRPLFFNCKLMRLL